MKNTDKSSKTNKQKQLMTKKKKKKIFVLVPWPAGTM